MNPNLFKWGMGLEHEVHMVWGKPIYVSGSDILNRFQNVVRRDKSYEYLNAAMREYLTSADTCSFPVFTLFDASKCINEIFRDQNFVNKITSRPLLDQYRILWDHFRNNDSKVTPDWSNLSSGCSHSDDDQGFQRPTNCFLEIVTKNPFDVSIDGITNQFNDIHESMLELVKLTDYYIRAKRKIQGRDRYDGDIMYANMGYYPFIKYYTDYEMNDYHYYSDYLGSYHINLTLPYLKNVEEPLLEQVRVDQEHFIFMSVFQWIQPLLTGAIGTPDFLSTILPNASKMSWRLMHGTYSNILSTNLPYFYRQPGKRIDRTRDMDNCDRKETCETNQIWLQVLNNNPFIYRDEQGVGTMFSDDRVGGDYRRAYEKFGVELRFFDNIPYRFIKPILDLIVTISDFSHNVRMNIRGPNPDNVDIVVSDDEMYNWLLANDISSFPQVHGNIINMMKDGIGNVEIGDVYATSLNRIFGTDLFTGNMVGINAFGTIVSNLNAFRNTNRGNFGVLPMTMLTGSSGDIIIPTINEDNKRIFYNIMNNCSLSKSQQEMQFISDVLSFVQANGRNPTVQETQTKYSLEQTRELVNTSTYMTLEDNKIVIRQPNLVYTYLVETPYDDNSVISALNGHTPAPPNPNQLCAAETPIPCRVTLDVSPSNQNLDFLWIEGRLQRTYGRLVNLTARVKNKFYNDAIRSINDKDRMSVILQGTPYAIPSVVIDKTSPDAISVFNSFIDGNPSALYIAKPVRGQQQQGIITFTSEERQQAANKIGSDSSNKWLLQPYVDLCTVNAKYIKGLRYVNIAIRNSPNQNTYYRYHFRCYNLIMYNKRTASFYVYSHNNSYLNLSKFPTYLDATEPKTRVTGGNPTVPFNSYIGPNDNTINIFGEENARKIQTNIINITTNVINRYIKDARGRIIDSVMLDFKNEISFHIVGSDVVCEKNSNYDRFYFIEANPNPGIETDSDEPQQSMFNRWRASMYKAAIDLVMENWKTDNDIDDPSGHWLNPQKLY